MAVISSTKDFWMHPNGLTFSINYFGNPQLIQTSLLAGAVILAYRKDVIGYNAAHNFREWKLQAFPTQLSDTCTYYVHVELSRTGNTAMVIYSPVIRDMQGRTLLSGNRVSGTYDDNVSSDSWFIYIGTLSASVDSDGNTVERAWTDGVYTGTLATDQYRMEEASGDWVNMFSLNSVTGLIDVLKTISKATINALTVAKEFVFGGKTLTGVAGASDTLDQSKVNDATLPTTGYTKKYVGDEIAALDDHFLIKDDPDTEQSVAGSVNFEKDVTVQGDHAVGKSQTIGGNQRIEGNTSVGGDVTIGSYTDTAGAVQGAKITKDGVGTFAGLKSKYFEIYELIYNIQTAEDGIKSFSDNGIIEEVLSVVEEASGASPHKFTHRITLKMRELRDGYLITFKPDDVIFGYVHNVGDSGSSAMGGQSWMLVRSIDNDTLTMEVMLYDQGELLDDDSITYILPTASMTITRWGNRTDTERQNTFYISTEQGNIVQLMGVTHPKIDVGNIGTVTGLLPSDLLAELQKRFSYINPKQPYFYGRGMIVQDLMEMDYLGNPIKKERYRGAWSKEVAISDDPYMVTPTTYDTVTHDGSLWMCQQSGNISEPSDTSTEWIKKVSKGSDASAVIYEIKPSANIVYVKGGSLSTSNLDVTIGRTDSNGYFDIADQAYLDSVGLLVQWAIDWGERHDLNISPDEPIDLEDESGELLAENGNALLLEGETIDISSIKDNITLYLVDTTTGNDMAERIIPVVKDGDSPYTIIATPPNINVLVNANDGSIISDVETAVYIYVKKGTSDIEPTMYYVDADEFETNSATQGIVKLINPIAQSGNKRWRVTIRINKGSYKQSDIPSLIRVKVFDRYATDDENNPLLIGYADVTPSISQRGLVGPAGETGPLLFPAGYLNFGESYSLVMDGDSVAAQPFYYYQTDEQKAEGIEGTYYVLQKNITAAENIESNLGNTDYWRPFTKIKYLFTEALMANWAKLAKFIFYAEFMFSQQGTNISGDEGLDWSSVAGKMFVKDEDGNIIGWTGEFIPNTMIDALRGVISCGKFIEQFDYFPSDTNLYRIDLSKAHNVYIPYKQTWEESSIPVGYYVSRHNAKLTSDEVGVYTVAANSSLGNSYEEKWYRYRKRMSTPRFVTLPEFSEEMAGAITEDLVTGTMHETMWLEDGTHVCIMHELSDKALDSTNESGLYDFDSPVIVFPDNDILDPSSYGGNYIGAGQYEIHSKTSLQTSYFVWRGIKVSAIILASGTMLKLRSSHFFWNGRNVRLWFVENASDFDVTKMTLNVDLKSNEAQLSGTVNIPFHLDPIGWRDAGRTVIGSCMLNYTLRDTSTGGDHYDIAYRDTIKTSLYNFYPHALYADEYSAMTFNITINGVAVNDNNFTWGESGYISAVVSNTEKDKILEEKKGIAGSGVTYNKY